MNTAKLKTFAQVARRQLIQEVAARLEHVTRIDSAAHREKSRAISNLEKEIKGSSKQAVIERAAYTWFNRFCALRFMDVNHYTRMGVVSPAKGFTQPEILAEAKQGHIDDELIDHLDRDRITGLLAGRIPSSNPQQEAYRILLVAVCNLHHARMPFLFQKIHDYTELLLPDDLLSENSILQAVRQALTPETCTDVEVIGWLYQFYISEKKDQVFEGLKKNKKITPENIPAATQLFTPHWIVRYLVENSLGRLWMLNRPNSRLIEQMEYYISSVASDQGLVAGKEETDFLRISSPEKIKICDPACGSGHMLTYAFDLLYAIYEEEGYDTIEIPRLILENNLFGVEIDERAGELAAFALFMKARQKDRRFFKRAVQPRVCVLKNVFFTPEEIATYMDAVGRDLFTLDLQETLNQFEEADNFGSLIRPALKDIEYVRRVLEEKDLSGNWILHETHQKVLCVLNQAEYLGQRYHVVVANPPYMGGKGMNGRLGVFAKENFPDSKSDLFAMFIERNLDMAVPKGLVAMITMQSWMFLSSFEKLRVKILGQDTILSMAHLGARAFDSIGGEVVSTTSFLLENTNRPRYKGGYLRLVDGNSEAEKNASIQEAIKNPDSGWFYSASADDFKKIPGEPIAYWVGPRAISSFDNPLLRDVGEIRQGLLTTDNIKYLRRWYELSNHSIGYNFSREQAQNSQLRWFPINKGGDFRKWYGNHEYVVDWFNDGEILHQTVVKKYPYLKGNSGLVLKRTNPYFEPAVTWTDISSYFGARLMPKGMLYEKGGSCAYTNDLHFLIGLFCSKLAICFLSALNPTLHFQVGDISNIPIIDSELIFKKVNTVAILLLQISKDDWDSYETSWDFKNLPLLNPDYRQPTLSATYQKLHDHWQAMTLEMYRLEEENNRIFIEAYGLQDELTPEVPLNEITLTCNPHYRYGNNRSEEELEALLLADTMKEFISYAVGCMFGRYSLDKPGLILANQGETLADFVRKVASDQWPVASKEGEGNVSEKLQGSDCLAEGHGVGGTGISSDKGIPEGGALRADQSGASGGSIGSFEHCGGASTSITGGVQKLSVDSTRFSGGSGNAAADCKSSTLSVSRTDGTDHVSPSGNQQNDTGVDVKTGHWPLTTSHLSFIPDDDNVIPILDGEWFTDDIVGRFRDFLRVTFGEEHYQENMAFIEQALGKDIRKYFIRDFYNDHVKRYKKRPIYWLFSSPKGSFNALIYMHRYRPDTISIILNDYLRDFRAKLAARKGNLEHISINASASQREKTQALKEIEKLGQIIQELDDYEREILYPLATKRVEIDLDDGVKVNYPKFGKALKKIPGLEVKEE